MDIKLYEFNLGMDLTSSKSYGGTFESQEMIASSTTKIRSLHDTLKEIKIYSILWVNILN